MNRLEGSGQFKRNLHADNYVYVERKDDKMARMGFHKIWRSRY
jgi:hypothetical protein